MRRKVKLTKKYLLKFNLYTGADMMGITIKIALAQLPVDDGSIEKNYKNIDMALDYAAGEKADILLTPEGSLSGYHNRFSQTELEKYLALICEKAAANKLGLALGTAFFEHDGCYNEIRFYDTDSTYLGAHTKTLLCGKPGDTREEISYFKTAPLRTFTFKGVTVAGLICNDLWANPGCTYMPDSHLTRILADLGAKIIFHAVNGGRDNSYNSQYYCKNFHEANLILRAQNSGVWIATVDNAAPVENPNSSYGGIVSPDGGWAMRMNDTGLQLAVYEINLQ